MYLDRLLKRESEVSLSVVAAGKCHGNIAGEILKIMSAVDCVTGFTIVRNVRQTGRRTQTGRLRQIWRSPFVARPDGWTCSAKKKLREVKQHEAAAFLKAAVSSFALPGGSGESEAAGGFVAVVL